MYATSLTQYASTVVITVHHSSVEHKVATLLISLFTYAGNTRSRNLCKQIVLYVQETCVGQSCKVVSCTIFLHAIANSSISRQKLSGTLLECYNMTGGPVVIDLSLVFGSFSVYNYVFSFHKDLKAEWNSDEIGFLIDFSQKKSVCV